MRIHDPAHPGEIARDNLEAEGWTVNECAARLGVSRITLSRLLNGRAGVSAAMALALERIGWGTADHWVRMQAAMTWPWNESGTDSKESSNSADNKLSKNWFTYVGVRNRIR